MYSRGNYEFDVIYGWPCNTFLFNLKHCAGIACWQSSNFDSCVSLNLQDLKWLFIKSHIKAGLNPGWPTVTIHKLVGKKSTYEQFTFMTRGRIETRVHLPPQLPSNQLLFMTKAILCFRNQSYESYLIL